MKKLITTIAILMIPMIAFASIDTNLKYGMKGSAVQELQEFLVNKGYLQGIATGNFYSLTLKAVKSFQSDNGIPNTGYVGALTRAEINKELDAEVASSTQAEIQDIGTTTLIISTSTDTDNTQKMVEQLQEQNLLLQQQIQLQNTQIQNTIVTSPIVPIKAEHPESSISNVKDNGVVTGILYLNIGAYADNHRMAKVECNIDGTQFYSIMNTNTSSDDLIIASLDNPVTLDTIKYSNGNHILNCQTTSMSGEMAKSSVTINIQNQ